MSERELSVRSNLEEKDAESPIESPESLEFRYKDEELGNAFNGPLHVERESRANPGDVTLSKKNWLLSKLISNSDIKDPGPPPDGGKAWFQVFFAHLVSCHFALR
jgi:hypothetical protein